MTAESDVILYNVPPSFYSQVARLVQAEKGVTWRTEIIAAGRPALTRWFEAVKQRPSYDAADTWDRVKPGKAFLLAVTLLWRYLPGVLFILTALCAAIWWLVGLVFQNPAQPPYSAASSSPAPSDRPWSNCSLARRA